MSSEYIKGYIYITTKSTQINTHTNMSCKLQWELGYLKLYNIVKVTKLASGWSADCLSTLFVFWMLYWDIDANSYVHKVI